MFRKNTEVRAYRLSDAQAVNLSRRAASDFSLSPAGCIRTALFARGIITAEKFSLSLQRYVGAKFPYLMPKDKEIVARRAFEEICGHISDRGYAKTAPGVTGRLSAAAARLTDTVRPKYFA